MAPFLFIDSRAISLLGNVSNCLSTSFSTSLASSIFVVIQIAVALSSCSACDNKSAAIYFALPVSSATTTISDGPAIISIFTIPYTSRFARATYKFPGPTILSTFGIDSVPYAKAAIACAPPIV
ncbi:Uncharacterised protein [Streptococcus pneumoniae]|nr:Uncharacterised protein [Streptococcus pneumoniae]CJI58645.1 Uncharacterised protein [Streptococcus pneumoniae]CKE77491.1 Uncharacterised protein [Streptococcus pneumoniae]COS65463.1 Uncharacterised protein [Streptococcus pneumoniae]CRH97648.1 Uncharacterised protein [Streptococcus pneumoniae]